MKEQALVFYQQYKTIIISIAMILSCFIIMVLGIIPQLKALIDNQKVYEEVSNQSKTLEVKAKVLETLESSDLEKKVGVVLYSLPPEKDYPATLNVIQAVALQNNFKLTNVQISQSLGASSKLTGFAIKAEVLGPRVSLDNFLDAIDKAPKVMKISSIEVSNPNKNETVSVEIGIDVFFAPVPNKLGLINSDLPNLTEEDNELLTALSKAVPADTNETFRPSPKGKSNPFE